jgi:hypothetical protein
MPNQREDLFQEDPPIVRQTRRDFVVQLFEDALKVDSRGRIYYGPPDVLPCIYLYRLGGRVVAADDCAVLASFKKAHELQVFLDEVADPSFERCEHFWEPSI